MEILKTVFIVLEILVSLLMIVVVLLQSGKEAGLSGAIAGNSDSYMSKGKANSWDKKLASATKWIALVWILLTLVLSFFPNA